MFLLLFVFWTHCNLIYTLIAVNFQNIFKGKKFCQKLFRVKNLRFLEQILQNELSRTTKIREKELKDLTSTTVLKIGVEMFLSAKKNNIISFISVC